MKKRMVFNLVRILQCYSCLFKFKVGFKKKKGNTLKKMHVFEISFMHIFSRKNYERHEILKKSTKVCEIGNSIKLGIGQFSFTSGF